MVQLCTDPYLAVVAVCLISLLPVLRCFLFMSLYILIVVFSAITTFTAQSASRFPTARLAPVSG